MPQPDLPDLGDNVVNVRVGHCKDCDAPIRISEGTPIDRNEDGEIDQKFVVTWDGGNEMPMATPHWLSCPALPPVEMLGKTVKADEWFDAGG